MPYTVTVQPSGSRFEVLGDESILDAALRHGVALAHGCRDGGCGSCKCRMTEGQVLHAAHPERVLPAWQKADGFVLTCCARPQSDVVLQATLLPAGAGSPRKLPARVLRAERRGDDVMLLDLQLPPVGAWRHVAGQYIDVLLRDGSRRSYSMANAPGPADGATTLELHVRHLPGGKFTDHVFGALKVQDLLRIEGPLGGFFLRDGSAGPLVLLASGTGLAPIKAIVDDMRARGIVRPTTLYWGCRRPSDLYLMDWLLEAERSMPHLHAVPVVSEPDAAWTGRTGFVHHAVMADWPDLRGHEVYACGVPVMVESAQRDFTARCGLPADAFFADAFISECDRQTAPPLSA